MRSAKFFIFFSLYAIHLTSCETQTVEQTNQLEQKPEKKEAKSAPDGMVFIQGGTYTRGSEGKQDNGQVYKEEFPPHEVTVKSFYMDVTEVTNAQFKKFVDETGYKTFAEVGPTKEDFPMAPPEMLIPGAAIFTPPTKDIDPFRNSAQTWWPFIKGASWKHPKGPGSSIDEIMDHPVVCVNYDDAVAYAKWAKKRLPTEAEWELAARGGLENKKYVWGDERKPDGKWMANCFQGSFPANNSSEDGYVLTSPVKSFPANGFGLYDISGNVWEICADYFRPDLYPEFVKNPTENPTGPTTPISDGEMGIWRQVGRVPAPNPDASPLTHLRVSKGGSFLCHIDYCLRYRPAARHQSEGLTPTNHTGFRCVKDVE